MKKIVLFRGIPGAGGKIPKTKAAIRLKTNSFSQTHESIMCQSSGAIIFILMSKDSPSFECPSMQEALIKQIKFITGKQVHKQTNSALRKKKKKERYFLYISRSPLTLLPHISLRPAATKDFIKQNCLSGAIYFWTGQ